MDIMNRDSLALTLDALNEAFFYNYTIPEKKRKEVANWIATRQGLPCSYANMFAPTESDLSEGIRLFTGERISSKAAIMHILGEEACRALILLDIQTLNVREALKNATEGMLTRIKLSDSGGRTRVPGTYCCGTCTSSYWRHLAVGGLENSENELREGIKDLRRHRDGSGRWRSYPFYYTLLSLSEMEVPSAIDEMRYTKAICERLLKRHARDERISQRRCFLLEKVLEKCK